MKKPGDDSEASKPDQNSRRKPVSSSLHCFPSLLEPNKALTTDALRKAWPSATVMIALWKIFLKNVHPVVMIFFDWEVELIVQRASREAVSLTHGDQSLMIAILLIATASLSEEECIDLLHEKKFVALAKFQEAVEIALLAADFIVTSDCVVLQAFMLYLVHSVNFVSCNSLG